jgi:hypothetical protein
MSELFCRLLQGDQIKEIKKEETWEKKSAYINLIEQPEGRHV